MNEASPVVSVCVANYNGIEIIDACLQSVIKQIGGIPVEILVHDDASDDNSVEYIRAKYPEVVLIETKVNVGFCVANNRMVEKASGQFVLLLNNDAALYPDALKTFLTEANRLGHEAILTLPQYDAVSGALVDRGCLLDPFFNPVPNLDPERTDVAMVIGACLWIPKHLWEELGGFPDWFESIAEDMYLCCRARLAGRAVRALSASGYRHWQGKSFGGNKPEGARLSSTFRRRFLSERNKLQVMLLTSRGTKLAWLLPIHIVFCLMETITICAMTRSWDYGRKVHLPAIHDVWNWLGPLRKIRHAVLKNRLATVADFDGAFTAFPRKLDLLLKYGIPRLK